MSKTEFCYILKGYVLFKSPEYQLSFKTLQILKFYLQF